MKRKVLIGFVFLLLLLLSACSDNTVYKKGFSYENHVTSQVVIAVKSNKKVHSIDDFSLDFYFGAYDEIDEYTNGNYQIVSFALYFSNNDFITENQIDSNNGMADYTSINDAHFIKEISMTSFNTNNYHVEMNIFGKTFNHHETISIPYTVILNHEGFIFTVIDIVYDQSTELYYFGHNGYQIVIYYTHLDNDSIELE